MTKLIDVKPTQVNLFTCLIPKKLTSSYVTVLEVSKRWFLSLSYHRFHTKDRGFSRDKISLYNPRCIYKNFKILHCNFIHCIFHFNENYFIKEIGLYSFYNF